MHSTFCHKINEVGNVGIKGKVLLRFQPPITCTPLFTPYVLLKHLWVNLPSLRMH